MAEVAKALGDPVRVQLVDVLRRHALEALRRPVHVRRSPAQQSVSTSCETVGVSPK
jgi:hypothetical protein